MEIFLISEQTEKEDFIHRWGPVRPPGHRGNCHLDFLLEDQEVYDKISTNFHRKVLQIRTHHLQDKQKRPIQKFTRISTPSKLHGV